MQLNPGGFELRVLAAVAPEGFCVSRKRQRLVRLVYLANTGGNLICFELILASAFCLSNRLTHFEMRLLKPNDGKGICGIQVCTYNRCLPVGKKFK